MGYIQQESCNKDNFTSVCQQTVLKSHKLALDILYTTQIDLIVDTSVDKYQVKFDVEVALYDVFVSLQNTQ